MEKLQTVSTKFRQQQEDGSFPANFMRHYYDLFCLLGEPAVREFIGTEDYAKHKTARFRGADNPILAGNDAFLLNDSDTRALYKRAYAQSRALYYKSQPPFDPS